MKTGVIILLFVFAFVIVSQVSNEYRPRVISTINLSLVPDYSESNYLVCVDYCGTVWEPICETLKKNKQDMINTVTLCTIDGRINNTVVIKLN
jgi:hypothetical protein